MTLHTESHSSLTVYLFLGRGRKSLLNSLRGEPIWPKVLACKSALLLCGQSLFEVALLIFLQLFLLFFINQDVYILHQNIASLPLIKDKLPENQKWLRSPAVNLFMDLNANKRSPPIELLWEPEKLSLVVGPPFSYRVNSLRSISLSKIIRIFLNFFFIEEYQLGAHFLLAAALLLAPPVLENHLHP